ncbi:helix-turn-helix transcriptional regulator [Pedobacter aquatilis]|uniref:helix-turn-helix domain-containing protein n=1 Tax=Pedobacter aquatilis TaxID=351343 RepID=UPI00292F7739|nr:helix-turn-helix transcriptional regulator [Pedobacter aquatilis]
MSTKNPRNENLIALFGANVRRYRLKSGWSINQLALECNVEYGTISTVERGLVNCSLSTAFAISQTLNISLDILTTEVVTEQ